MRWVLIVVMSLGLALSNIACMAPVALGAAVVGAGAGAQAGWWFGKKSKDATQGQEPVKKEATDAGKAAQ